MVGIGQHGDEAGFLRDLAGAAQLQHAARREQVEPRGHAAEEDADPALQAQQAHGLVDAVAQGRALPGSPDQSACVGWACGRKAGDGFHAAFPPLPGSVSHSHPV